MNGKSDVEKYSPRENGIKHKVRKFLESAPNSQFTLSEITEGIGLNALSRHDVASCLVKLRNQGLITSQMGNATSNLGRRYVKHYKFIQRKRAAVVVTLNVDDVRRELSLLR